MQTMIPGLLSDKYPVWGKSSSALVTNVTLLLEQKEVWLDILSLLLIMMQILTQQGLITLMMRIRFILS